MPQLDLTFFFMGALSTAIAFFVLLYAFDAVIVPKIAEAMKLRSKLANVSETFAQMDEVIVEEEEFTSQDLEELLANYNNEIKQITI